VLLQLLLGFWQKGHREAESASVLTFEDAASTLEFEDAAL